MLDGIADRFCTYSAGTNLLSISKESIVKLKHTYERLLLRVLYGWEDGEQEVLGLHPEALRVRQVSGPGPGGACNS